jgi:hypothetical protein
LLRGITTVSEKGQIYQVDLEATSGEDFEFLGYSDIRQLGRFYSLTLNKKITRLYTSVGFLDTRNLAFMQQTVRVVDNLLTEEEKLEGNKSKKLVLLMKKYNAGELT